MRPFRAELASELNRVSNDLGLGKNGEALIELREAEIARLEAERKLREAAAALSAAGVEASDEKIKKRDAEKAARRRESLAQKLEQATEDLATFREYETVQLPPEGDPNRALLDQIADLKNQKPSQVEDRDGKIEALTAKLTVSPKGKLIRLATLEKRIPKLTAELKEVSKTSDGVAAQKAHQEASKALATLTDRVGRLSKKATLPAPGSPAEANLEKLITLRAQQGEKIKQEEKRLASELMIIPPQALEDVKATAEQVARLMKDGDHVMETPEKEGLAEIERDLAKAYEKLELQLARSKPQVWDYLKGLTAETAKYALGGLGGTILLGAMGAYNPEAFSSVADLIYRSKMLILTSASPYLQVLGARFMSSGNWRDLIPFRPTYLKWKAAFLAGKQAVVDRAHESRAAAVRATLGTLLPDEDETSALRKTRAKICVQVALAVGKN